MSHPRALKFLQHAAIFLAISWLPTVNAYCYIDVWGYERCTLGTIAYAGIAIGCTILGFILLCVGICVRRRRVTRRVVYVDPAPAAVTTVTTTPYIPPSQPLYNQPTGGFDPYAPAYPPPIAQPGFAPQGAPPQYYANEPGKV
ncbi:hypothetical protein NLI96_g9372 [Meripilus lineatus]|uniref:Uncharacterized protein n=1 Tax=Meripilus lineatus TaxID=2056292 RepID=A0AAD5YCZ6_9APHY|nr:hypothetical protein NLI96_g9372 [Physisporinus lineatus]